MDTTHSTSETLKVPKRRGIRGEGYRHTNVTLPAELAEWAKDLPGGLSGTLRRLLTEEYKRHEAKARKT